METFESTIQQKKTLRMSCEKASRRLRFLLTKARRLGFTTDEVVELPAAKKLLSARVTSASAMWTILVMMALFFGGGVVLILFSAPCVSRSGT